MKPVARALLVVACLGAVACDQDLPKATEITDMRLLGAVVEVVGDPTRATPRPGEKVDVRFVAVHPTLAETNAQAQTMLLSCTQPTRYTGGVPVCQEFLRARQGAKDLSNELMGMQIPTKGSCSEELLKEGLKDGLYYGTMALRCIDGDPAARLRVSRAFSGAQMLYRGVVCERGDASIDLEDPLLFGCLGNDGETTRVHGTVTIQHDAKDENHNPNLSGARFFLGTPASEDGGEVDGKRRTTTGAAWPLVADEDLPAEDACLGSVPKCDADAEDQTGVLCQYAYGRYRITVQYDPTLREKLDGEYEDLEFSVFATAGELDRRFVVFESDMKPIPVSRPIACRDDADCAGHTGAYCRALNCVEDVKAANPRTGKTETKQHRVSERADVLQGAVDWTVPDELRGRSQLVRFFFTALDRRGGFAVTSRALCLN